MAHRVILNIKKEKFSATLKDFQSALLGQIYDKKLPENLIKYAIFLWGNSIPIKCLLKMFNLKKVKNLVAMTNYFF